ncbi:MAG: hypothetical protein IKG83_07765, partial [Prevotella sp.]|nr:hypothetical protein [Prevotella sp.]
FRKHVFFLSVARITGFQWCGDFLFFHRHSSRYVLVTPFSVLQPIPTLNPILQSPESQFLISLFLTILRCFSVRHLIRTLKNRKKQFHAP